LYDALPLLERFEVPATFYLTSSGLDGSGEFWWDELERLLIQPGVLPETLSLRIGERSFSWRLGAFTELTEEGARTANWRAWEPPPTPRHALYAELWALLHKMCQGERQRCLAVLRSWAGTTTVTRQNHRPMTNSEVVTLGRSDMAAIGAHTHTHPSLAVLDEREQWHEIDGNRSLLESVVARPVHAFSYPFGKPTDYTATTVALLRRAGFTSAVCNSNGRIEKTSDVLQLPRCFVENLSPDQFANWLHSYD
jgi:peptidoglycan/xylan/chitin deacetylase (PgdA/CDA1 family)